MSMNKIPETIGELLSKIRESKNKLVIITFGEKVNSPYLSRRQYKMRVYYNSDIGKVLEKAQRVFKESSFYSSKSVIDYAKSFCSACNVISQLDVPFPRLCKRHRSLIEIPLWLWNSNFYYVFGFYVLKGDVVFLFYNERWLLVANNEVAFIKRPDNTVFKYRKRIKQLENGGQELEHSSYNIIANKILSIISQLEYILLPEIEFIDP